MTLLYLYYYQLALVGILTSGNIVLALLFKSRGDTRAKRFVGSLAGSVLGLLPAAGIMAPGVIAYCLLEDAYLDRGLIKYLPGISK